MTWRGPKGQCLKTSYAAFYVNAALCHRLTIGLHHQITLLALSLIHTHKVTAVARRANMYNSSSVNFNGPSSLFLGLPSCLWRTLSSE